MRVVAVGECTIDRYPALGAERVGGISLNFAVNARREGAERVSLVSATGTDAGAAAVRRKLAAEGIDASHLHVISGPTASPGATRRACSPTCT
jgi:sugar/nucleoside kinase (ribokinase family)